MSGVGVGGRAKEPGKESRLGGRLRLEKLTWK